MAAAGRNIVCLSALLTAVAVCRAEPVVLRGEQVPALLGAPVSSLRLVGRDGTLLPLQVDEVTEEGEYVCDRGTEPNADSGNAVLDRSDEIVFMYEDCLPCRDNDQRRNSDSPENNRIRQVLLRIGATDRCREALLCADTSLPVCTRRYISYDHTRQLCTTPRYYARFAPDRFHFVRAGIAGKKAGTWIDLTRELRIDIQLRALWGLLPVHYTEDNLICFVKRYKVGPLRLIRRGDLHLQLGPGIRGSRAAVNQICYPSMVSVPVSISLPVRFKHFFRDAYLEMAPVITDAGADFLFSVPGCAIGRLVGGCDTVTEFIPCELNANPFTLLREGYGLGWVVQSDIPSHPENRSGFMFNRPSIRSGRADCGYRLMIQDVPRGRYTVVNRVLFTRRDNPAIAEEFKALRQPATVVCNGKVSENRLTYDIMSGEHRRNTGKNP
jgi:hypothetical protein